MSPKTSNNGFLFPLYLFPKSQGDFLSALQTQPRANLSIAFLQTLSKTLDIETSESSASLVNLLPESIFYYIYAIFYSPNYRTRYAEFLKIDFPRVPLPGGRSIFDALAEKGGELVALHLLESPKLDALITDYIGPAAPTVEKVSYSDGTVWLDKGQTLGFRGVPQAVWAFHIGGYQVCEKWLKDRKGRTLSAEDLRHYQRVVVALSETIRLMAEIDAVIDQHGGFPGAFAAGPAPLVDAAVVEPDAEVEPAAQPTLLDVAEVPEQVSLFAADVSSGRSAISAPTADTRADADAPPDIASLSKDELMAAIRDAFDAANAMTRDELIRQTAHGLGYRRTGSRIADVLDDAIRTAVRRGFVEREEDLLKLYRSPIDTWDRDWLKREFLAAIGRPWIEREDAVRAFSRWLGYRRTSPLFDETTRSIINGLLRENRLEANANFVRRVS